MRRKNWLIAGVIAIGAVLLGRMTYTYRLWKRGEVERVRSQSQIVETARGPVECLIEGSGPAVLIAHGSPGGYDQAAAFAKLIESQGQTFIAVSRPGYLRTPLAAGETPEEQADLYVALLDALKIQSAAVMGISGGGPSALQFALRHATRCRGLVMISGVTRRYYEQKVRQTLPGWKRLIADVYDRLLVFDPMLYLILSLTRLQYRPGATASADLVRAVMHYPLRKAGYENDMRQFEALPERPALPVSVPTFVMHGTRDDEVPFTDAQWLVEQVPGATFLAIAGGTHMAFYIHASSVMPKLRSFLKTL